MYYSVAIFHLMGIKYLWYYLYLRQTLSETIDNITYGKFCFPDSLFGRVSSAAKDLISIMFTVEPDDRPTAAECLEHPWFQKPAPHTPVLQTEAFSDRRSSFYRHYKVRSEVTFLISSRR